MVSNDDVGFDVQQTSLATPISLIHPGQTATRKHEFTVPNDKQWIISGVSLYRSDSYNVQFYIFPFTGAEFVLFADIITMHLYEPVQPMVLDEGWKITVQYFYNSITYTCATDILFEERNKY